ncbi:MAG TPA: hypothetical protein PLM29_10955, partial [Deltaproteobacteria bacterium]|nr:hypothetical protein [Deltaproteobacteria bacterium]
DAHKPSPFHQCLRITALRIRCFHHKNRETFPTLSQHTVQVKQVMGLISVLVLQRYRLPCDPLYE